MKIPIVISSLFKSPTLQETIAEELKMERDIISTCDKAIQSYIFQRAISQAKVTVLENWIIKGETE
jgi:hypothetical protein